MFLLVAQQALDMGADESADLLQPVGHPGHSSLDVGADLLERRFADAEQQLLLAADVIVERSLLDTEGGGDFARAGSAVAARRKQRSGGIKEPFGGELARRLRGFGGFRRPP